MLNNQASRFYKDLIQQFSHLVFLFLFFRVPSATTPQPDLNKGGPHTPLGGPPTPSNMNDLPPKYTGPNTPNTPGSVTGDNFSVPSPQGPGGDGQQQRRKNPGL